MPKKEKEFIPMVDEEDLQKTLDLINQYTIPVKNIRIRLEEDNTKYLAGVSGNFDKSILDHFKYEHFIESVNDLSEKTKMSIELCVRTYNEMDYNSFNFLNNDLTQLERMAYYHMENALFREIVLWDSLAQMYNVYLDLGKDVDKVSYRNVFRELHKSHSSEINIKQIFDYINAPYDRLKPTMDVGIHTCVSDTRHQMMHRFSIAKTSISGNYNDHLVLRSMPDLIYKIALDYNKIQKYLIDIIEAIMKKEHIELNDKIIG